MTSFYIRKKKEKKRLFQVYLESVWHYVCNCVSLNFEYFFFLLKLSAVCTFWIVLMCWYQKWFLKNEKISLACISARKAIWKATVTTLPNTLLIESCMSLVKSISKLILNEIQPRVGSRLVSYHVDYQIHPSLITTRGRELNI